MKTANQIIIFLVLVGMVLVSGCASYKNTLSKDYCVKDNDCTIVQQGCCSCNMGGKATAISKYFRMQWETNLSKECKDIDCLAVISNDWTCKAVPKCVDNRCVLK